MPMMQFAIVPKRFEKRRYCQRQNQSFSPKIGLRVAPIESEEEI
jgi:hypothetical protein